MEYNRKDRDIPVEKRKPINIYIMSFGGELYPAYALISTILASKTPVNTINMGVAMSAGLLILLAGHKRYAMKYITAMKKIMLGALLLWGCVCAGAQTFEVGNVKYSILSAEEMTAQIESTPRWTSDDIWIPDEVQYQGQNYTVVKAGPSSFIYSESRNIRLPGGLKEIAKGAFWWCRAMRSIDLPWSLEVIGETAFEGCTLESINIPGSVRTIGKRAFANCPVLASVQFNGGVESIGENAFSGCAELEELIVPKSVKFIDKNAFAYCGNLAVVCTENSFVHKYCMQNEIKYRTLPAGVMLPNGEDEVDEAEDGLDE